MYYYIYERPGHPDHGTRYAFADDHAQVIASAPEGSDDCYLVPIDAPPGPSLEKVKAGAIARVNRSAGNSRAKFITVIPGQETTYAEKRTEAQAYQRTQNPQASDYPMLAAEAAATGQTLEAVAAEVLTLAGQWRQLGAHIEGVRRGAIVQVQQAKSVEEVEAVRWTFP